MNCVLEQGDADVTEVEEVYVRMELRIVVMWASSTIHPTCNRLRLMNGSSLFS